MQFPGRFRWLCPETGKKADLMFVQHMLAVLADRGMVCTVMPHGVLFRGGKEREIRAGLLDDGRCRRGHRPRREAVLRDGHPGVHPGAPRQAAAPAKRRDKVLFINADREFTPGRAQNHLGPQHVEKIVAAYHDYQDIPGFARVVDIQSWRTTTSTSNRAPRQHPTARAPGRPRHLHGRVPKAEVRTHEARFAAYGIDVHSLFTERDRGYYDFPPVGWPQTAEQIPDLAAPKEAELREAFDDWWNRHVKHIIELPDTKQVMDTRKDLLDSFVTALEPLGILDRFQLAGVIASWWGDVQYDIGPWRSIASAASCKAG